jgi:hypothetical protein
LQADQKPPWAPAGQENVLLKEIQELGAGAAALTQDADSDVQAAFRSFVDRQLGVLFTLPDAFDRVIGICDRSLT